MFFFGLKCLFKFSVVKQESTKKWFDGFPEQTKTFLGCVLTGVKKWVKPFSNNPIVFNILLIVI